MMNLKEKYLEEVKLIDKEYKKNTLYLNINPVKVLNASEERVKFFDSYYNKKVYNPVFVFEKRKINYKFVSGLKDIKIDLSYDPYNLKKLFKEKIEEKLFQVKLIETWGTFESDKYVRLTKGEPSYFMYLKALKYCFFNKRKVKDSKLVSVEDLAKALKDEVFNLTGDDIKVEFALLPNKASIVASKKIIYLNPDEVFTEYDLRRLKIHEVGTHYLRYYNGKLAGFHLLATGLANYSETEEGLAVFMEEKHGINIKSQLYVYAARLIAAYNCHKSFHEIFVMMKKLGFDDNDAYSIAFRVKRNVSNTKDGYGYVKDYVYFSGYYKVLKFSKKHDVNKLFIGKIKVRDVFLLEDFIKENNFKLKLYE